MSAPAQVSFAFPIDNKPFPARPTVVLRWRDDGVAATWPEFGLKYWYRSWADALDAVMHPVNSHVRVKVVA